MSESHHQRTYLLFNRQIKKLSKRLQKMTLPGFEGVPLYDAIWFFIKGIQKGSLTTRASSIAFNFLLAIGPAVIFLLAMIPYLPIENFQQELYGVLNQVMPENSYIAIESLLDEIFHKRAGLPFFGFLVSLFFAQKGIHGMIEAFNVSYHLVETRKWLKRRMIAILLVFIYYFLVIFAVLLMFFNKSFIKELVELDIIKRDLTFYLILSGRWLIIVALTFFCISFLYFMAPQRETKWRFYSAGSTLATLLVLLASIGFSYFVNHFAQFNKFFGSIGALVALMLWINFNALSLLIGFELNASIKKANLKQIEQ
jgi:membrane protein